MEKIVFYDVSHNCDTRLGFPTISDGQELDILDLISRLDFNAPPEIKSILENFQLEKIDPRGIEKTQSWENLMTVIIYCFSGKIPLRQEVVIGRQIIFALPKHLRNGNNVWRIAFSILPYMLIGFKSHIGSEFIADSNKVRDVAEFITRLFESSNPVAQSFLCAHRESGEIAKLSLVNSVHREKAEVALNVTKGILSNMPVVNSKAIHWYQQGATEWACMNMFPEMFIRYMEEGHVPELLQLLEKHFSELKDLIKSPDPNIRDSNLLELDPVTNEVLTFLSTTYGIGWKSTDFSKSKKDRLISLALDITLPNITRLMPFYSSSARRSFSDRKNFFVQKNGGAGSQLVTSAINRFFENQLMHPTAKAMYETAFYYLWGQRCALNNNLLSIGIDRDHDDFQYFSWKEGFANSSREGIPLIYGRRTTNTTGPALKDYSLRQFWR